MVIQKKNPIFHPKTCPIFRPKNTSNFFCHQQTSVSSRPNPQKREEEKIGRTFWGGLEETGARARASTWGRQGGPQGLTEPPRRSKGSHQLSRRANAHRSKPGRRRPGRSAGAVRPICSLIAGCTLSRRTSKLWPDGDHLDVPVNHFAAWGPPQRQKSGRGLPQDVRSALSGDPTGPRPRTEHKTLKKRLSNTHFLFNKNTNKSKRKGPLGYRRASFFD